MALIEMINIFVISNAHLTGKQKQSEAALLVFQ